MTLGNLDGAVAEQNRDVSQLDAFQQQRDRERVSEAMRVAANNRRFCGREQFLKHSIPTLDRGLTLALAVPEEEFRPLVGQRSRAFTAPAEEGSRRACLSFVCRETACRPSVARAPDKPHPEVGGRNGAAAAPWHSASGRTCPSQPTCPAASKTRLTSSSSNGKRRRLRHLRRLDRLRRVSFDPLRLFAESEEPAQVLEPLDRRGRGEFPGLSEGAQRVDVQVLERLKPLASQYGSSLPSSSSRRLRMVVGRGGGLRRRRSTSEAPLDRRNFELLAANLARGLPLVNGRRGDAPIASVEGSLYPLTTQRTLRPDGAIAAGPAAALRTMGTGAGMPAI